MPIKEEAVEIYQSGVSHVKRTEMLAGHGAQHCGAVEVTSKDIYNCISGSYKKLKPFYVYFPVRGIDSVIWVSVAYDGENLFILNHDTFGLEEKYTGYKCLKPKLVVYDESVFKLDAPFICA